MKELKNYFGRLNLGDPPGNYFEKNSFRIRIEEDYNLYQKVFHNLDGLRLGEESKF